MEAQVQPRVRTGGIWTFLRLLRESPRLTVGLVLLLILAAAAIVEPVINNARLQGRLSTEMGDFDVHAPSSPAHPLGTDDSGRDVLALQFTGLRNSLLIGLVAGGLGTAIAVIMACLGGYLGGRTEMIITGITNSVLIIPSWPIVAIIVLFVFKPGVLFMSAVLAFFTWPFPTRVIMPQIASLRERPFIDLARMTGQGSWSIMFREIVPNFLPFIVLGLTTSISGSIMAETGLRIIGLGPVQLVTLGQLINWTLYAGTLSQGYFAIALSPIILLVLVFVALNFVNFGLEEVYNPRLKKITGL
ncbi:MAG TPA: ABC transporter permease [Spirochaetia bacterium]|nr:ABC transporter permease [Spirochaetia bacterium]